MYRSVLVVLDHEAWSRLALLDAADIALGARARLTIACPVARVPWTVYPASLGVTAPVSFEQLAADAQRACLRLRDDAVTAVPRDVPVTTVMPTERTPAAIVREIARGGHDLVVIATPPSARWAPWRTAFARRLVRRCPVPVLTVPAPRRERRVTRSRPGRPARVGAAVVR